MNKENCKLLIERRTVSDVAIDDCTLYNVHICILSLTFFFRWIQLPPRCQARSQCPSGNSYGSRRVCKYRHKASLITKYYVGKYYGIPFSIKYHGVASFGV